MATYTAQNAIDLTRKFVKDVPMSGSSVDIIVCDIVNSIMWTAYPWRFTLAALTALSLVNNQQDYTVTNTDFYRPIRMRVVKTNVSPNTVQELDIVESLPPNLQRTGASAENFTRIAYDDVTSKLRLDRAASVTAPVTMQIQGEYQKTPTKITALTAVLPWPDYYFPVYAEGVLWKAYQFTDDDRAGKAQFSDGKIYYDGQAGIFYDGLRSMVLAEDLGRGQPYRFAPNVLGLTSGGYLGKDND